MPTNVLIRERLTPELITAICNVFDLLKDRNYALYFKMEKKMWCRFFNKRLKDFGHSTDGYMSISIEYIENTEHLWYEKLDYLEKVMECIMEYSPEEYKWMTKQLNNDFRSLRFAYRVTDGLITEISPEDDNNGPKGDEEENLVKVNVRRRLVAAFYSLFV